MIELKKGDIFLTTNNKWLGKSIRKAQKIIDSSDPIEFSHGGIVLDENGEIFESVAKISKNNINKYIGEKILIARHQEMTDFKFERGLAAIEKYEGKIYPFWRLPLFFVGLADNLYFLDWPVCTELCHIFCLGAGIKTGIKKHGKNHWAGTSPDMFEDAIQSRNDLWTVIYKGKLEK